MDVRASDAERDAAVERLRAAAAEGRLTFEELADRIEAAASRGHPRATRAAHRGPARPRSPIRRRRADATSARSTTSSAPARGSSPPRAASAPGSATISLDLRDARISEPEIHIHAWALFGTIDLLVPEGVEVDVRAQSKLGQRQAPGGRADRPGRAAGSCSPAASVFGAVKVRHKRLWEKVLGLAR